MKYEEIIELNRLLTKLRCEIQKFMVSSDEAIPPSIEFEYDMIIDEINDILRFSIIDGGENND